MSGPVIGLTTYGRGESNRYSLPAEYVDAVRRAGGVPALLPPGNGEPGDWLARNSHHESVPTVQPPASPGRVLDRVLDRPQACLRARSCGPARIYARLRGLTTTRDEQCGLDLLDGLVLSGGGDIDPARYGGGPHETLYNIDQERDACELALLAAALERRMPVFAICRGMQVLNVLLGGSLHEHLPDAFGEGVQHRAPPREPIPHALRILPDTFLGGLLKQEEIEAASCHHQGIKTLGRGLIPAGYAPDGVLEACELPGHPWLVAVQWHPELTAATDPIQQGLFDALVKAAKAV
jgi:putative glutamine amidotransferase